jgi:hypothetical protein
VKIVYRDANGFPVGRALPIPGERLAVADFVRWARYYAPKGAFSAEMHEKRVVTSIIGKKRFDVTEEGCFDPTYVCNIKEESHAFKKRPRAQTHRRRMQVSVPVCRM